MVPVRPLVAMLRVTALCGILLAATVAAVPKNEKHPSLQDKGHQCSTPKVAPNARVRLRYDGKEAYFLCDWRLKPLGAVRAICVDGKWSSPPPLCVGTGCEEITHFLHGQLTLGYNGAVARFACGEGYTLKGNTVLVCDGTLWNGTFPECFENTAAATQNSPRWATTTSGKGNKWAKPSASPSHQEMLSKADYTCIKSAKTVAPPRIPNALGFTKWALLDGKPRLYTVYRCKWNHVFSGSGRNLYCQKGAWIGTEPSCIPVGKGENKALNDQPSPGHVMHENMVEQSDYTCMGSVANRERMQPPNIANGVAVLRHSMQQGTPRIYAQYTCHQGYQLKDEKGKFMYCKDRKWLGKMPLCVPQKDDPCGDNGGCSQHCVSERGKARCSCMKGYDLAGDGKTCKDVNECATKNAGCAHHCSNTEGSYVCHCYGGYSLSPDSHSCVKDDTNGQMMPPAALFHH